VVLLSHLFTVTTETDLVSKTYATRIAERRTGSGTPAVQTEWIVLLLGLNIMRALMHVLSRPYEVKWSAVVDLAKCDTETLHAAAL
jgi:hypothetical protein